MIYSVVLNLILTITCFSMFYKIKGSNHLLNKFIEHTKENEKLNREVSRKLDKFQKGCESTLHLSTRNSAEINYLTKKIEEINKPKKRFL